jgi:hypothetical protein
MKRHFSMHLGLRQPDYAAFITLRLRLCFRTNESRLSSELRSVRSVPRQILDKLAIQFLPRRLTQRNSAVRNKLTFETKGEIIISSGGIADLPAHLGAVLALLAH